MHYVDAEGSKSKDKRRLSLLDHRGQRTWHAYKGRISEDGRSECFPHIFTGRRLLGIIKARLLKATVIAHRQRYELILQVKGICDKGKPESRRRALEVRASKYYRK